MKTQLKTALPVAEGKLKTCRHKKKSPRASGEAI